LRRLRGLNLFLTNVTPARVRAIAESSHAAGLEYLNVGDPFLFGDPYLAHGRAGDTNPEHEAIARAVAGSPHLANLKELDLSQRRIGLDGLRAIIESPHLKNLRRLRLRYCALSPYALKLAAEAANFRGLYLLELGIRRQNYNRTEKSDPEQDALRAALPDAAIRFE
jgi:hypothetical protein